MVGVLILPACANEVSDEPVVKLPPREHTWVRKETVKKTKEAFFAKQAEAPMDIPVNEALKKRLSKAQPSKDNAAVTDAASCLASLKPLDQKRMAVQKVGGMWHAFERSPEVRPFSENGMQIDSTLNKMVASLRHLCKSAEGLALDTISHVISKKVAEKGRDVVAQELKELGKTKEDITIWLDHAEYWKKNATRNLDYQSIEGLMNRMRPMIGLYEELTQRPVDETTKQSFLSDAVTLLNAMKTLSTTDEYMVLALREDKEAPYENFDPDM